MRWNNSILVLAASIFLLASCGVGKPAGSNTSIRYVDSLRVRDSTVFVELPAERIVDVAASYDTLRMETSAAVATAYLDTALHCLRGSLENKLFPIKGVVHFTEKTIIRDSVSIHTVTRNIKVPVEVVPWHYWLWFATSIIFLLFIFAKVYFKLRK